MVPVDSQMTDADSDVVMEEAVALVTSTAFDAHELTTSVKSLLD
jgi:hypothetical protein